MSEIEADFIPFDFEDDYFASPSEEPSTLVPVNESKKGSKSPKLERDSVISRQLLLPLPLSPWHSKKRAYSKDLLEMLHQEIEDYTRYISPSKSEHDMRRLAVERIKRCVNHLWPEAKVEIFGSFETKLYLPSSDIDICIFDSDLFPPRCLYDLAKILKESGVAQDLEVIDKAKVPIIKFKDALTQLPIDVSFNIEGGVIAADMVKKFLCDPVCGGAIKPLMLILKQYLQQRYLNEVYLGGLGSYGLLIMIASFLKLHPLVQAKKIKAKDNLGVLLIEFFELYGRFMNYPNVGIGVDLKGSFYYSRESERDGKFKPQIISLKDPQDESNDVGRGSYNFHLIKSEFFKSYHLLSAIMASAYDDQYKYKQQEATSILGFILTLKKETLTLRQDLEVLADEIQQGLIKNVLPTFEKESPVKVLSCDVISISSSEDQCIYVAASSEEEQEEEMKFQTLKRKKISKIAKSKKKKRHS